MQSRSGWVLAVALFAMGPIAGYAPLGFAPLLHMTGLGCLIAYRLDHRKWPIPTGPVVLPLCLLAAWMTLTWAWTTAPHAAAIKVPELLAIGLSGLIVPVAVHDLPDGDARRVQNGLLWGLPLGLLICFGDMVAGSPLKMLHWRWDTVPVNAYDREIIVLGLLLFPAALIATNRGYKWPAIGALMAYTFGILFLQSHSGMVGMVLGLAALAVAWRFPICMRMALSATCVAGFALCIPVAFLLWNLGADHWDGLQFSFRHRVQIWHFTADRIMLHPLIGLGLESSRNIPLDGLAPGFISLDHDNPPLHPHNCFLQVWLELGAIGVALTLAVLMRTIATFKILPQPALAYTLAISVAYLAIATFAFGIWQGWWMAILAFIAPLMAISRKQLTT
jgi:hypothetical protein